MGNTKKKRGYVLSGKSGSFKSKRISRGSQRSKTMEGSSKSTRQVTVHAPVSPLTVVPDLTDEKTYRRLRDEAEAELRADRRNAQRSALRSLLGIG